MLTYIFEILKDRREPITVGVLVRVHVWMHVWTPGEGICWPHPLFSALFLRGGVSQDLGVLVFGNTDIPQTPPTLIHIL